MQQLTHITINTGNVATLPPPDPNLVRAGRVALRLGGDLSHLAPSLGGWRADVAADGDVAAYSIGFGGIPAVECVFCASPARSAEAWRHAERLYLDLSDKAAGLMDARAMPERPAATPWLAAVILPSWAATPFAAAAHDIGLAERCLAWALLSAPERRGTVFEIENAGPEIRSTNYWDVGGETVALSFNARALRVLLPASMGDAAQDAATGRVAVLTIGADARYGGRRRAHIMFDDGSQSPYCIESDLGAFDRIPPASDAARRDLECLVYAPGLQLAARMPLRLRFGAVPDYTPAP